MKSIIKTHPGRRLRNAMNEGCVQIPGAFNGLVARIAAQKGFKALYLSGGATSAATGVPDIGLLSMESFVERIKEITRSTTLPLIVDADTGFGEGEMCARTVHEYNLAGAAGLHLEDQVFPKRCGHLDGKSLIPKDDMVNKIRIAAHAAQECSEGEFIICARTDAAALEGIEESIERAKAYIKAGADMIFPQGLRSASEFEQVAKEIKVYAEKEVGRRVYMLANMTEFGKTPYLHISEFAKLGYDCVIYPVSTLRIAMKAVQLFLEELGEKGTAEHTLERMMTRKELYAHLKYTPGEEWYFPNPTIKKP